MSIPLVQKPEKDDINTSIIAIKRNIERINMLLGLVDSGSPDLSGFVKKSDIVDVVESGNNNPVTSNAVYSRNYKNGTWGALGGANQASSKNIVDLLNNELCGNGGMGGICGGSIFTETSTLGVPTGWYNFLYIPHRGGRGGDNTEYGTLYLTPFSNDGNLYIVQRVGGTNYNANIYKSVNLLQGIETYTIDANTHIFLNWVKKGDVCSLNFSSDVPIPVGTYYIPRGSVPPAVLGTSAGGFQITWGTIAVGYGFLTTAPNGSFAVVITQQSVIEAYKTYVCY